MNEMVTIPREVVESMQKRLTAALDEPCETMSDAKALREIVRQLRLMRDELSTALAAGEARPEPVTDRAPPKASDVMAFLKALNGGKGDLDAWLECADEHEVRETIRAAFAAPPQPAEPVVTPQMVEAAREAWQVWRYNDDESRMRAALVAAMGVRNG